MLLVNILLTNIKIFLINNKSTMFLNDKLTLFVKKQAGIHLTRYHFFEYGDTWARSNYQ